MLTGGSWCLLAEFGAYRRELVFMGRIWRLQAEVGARRQKLALMGGSWCFQILEIFQIEKVGAKF